MPSLLTPFPRGPNRPQVFLISNVIMLYFVLDSVPSFVTNWNKRASQLWTSRSLKIDLVVGIVIVATISVPLWSLYSSHMLSESAGRVWAGGSCWADLPIHSEVHSGMQRSAVLPRCPPSPSFLFSARCRVFSRGA